MKRLFRLAVAALSVPVLLAACGGGSSQVEAFLPDRVIAFGDEHSVFTSDGRKHTVNALKTDGSGAVDCDVHPLWIQTVASVYGYRFSQCPGTLTEFKAVTRAVAGATVAGLRAQIDVQAAAGLNAKDMVLMMAGANDVRQIYEARAAGESDELLIARASERGIEYGNQVNRVVALGPRVIVTTITDLGITPYGLARGSTEAALLTRLSAAFNARMRVTILNDGRFVGLVLADEVLQSAYQVPSAYGISNVNTAICRSSAVLPDCSTTTLVDGANVTQYLWADALRFSQVIHAQIGTIAAARAQQNPF